MLAKLPSIAAGLACTVALVALAGCQSPPQPATTAAAPAAAAVMTGPVAPSAGALAYAIDPARSVVTVVVRRAGPLARLGHDHVITSADEHGTVWLGAAPADSAFAVSLPVDRFEVDLPAARAAAGPEFSTPVPDDARAGTRQNLLRPAVLDAEAFPEITLRSAGASGDWPQSLVQIVVTLKGVERTQSVPVSITRDATGLVARGALRLRQSDFGITPFSVAGGAIQVADVLEVSFVIAAVRQ
jgi:polyisoprenoid-binding protein YceI